MNKNLVERLCAGFGSSAGREKQIGAYQAICNEAADEIESLSILLDLKRREINRLNMEIENLLSEHEGKSD